MMLPTTVTLVDSEEGCRDLVERLQSLEEVGFDTEASGPQIVRRGKKSMLNPYRATLTGFSVAERGGGNWYVPIDHNTGNAPLQPALNVLRCALDRNKVWAHNWKFDALMVEKYHRIDPTKMRDSMVASWLSARPSNSGKYDLKSLAKDRLGIEMASFLDTLGGKTQWREVTPQEGLAYAGADAWATLLLGKSTEKIIEEFNLADTFLDYEMPFVFLLLDMEKKGIGIDRGRMGALEEDLATRASALEEEWEFLFPDVSISSAVQLRNHFYGNGLWKDHLVKKTPTGALKVDKEALEIHKQACATGSLGREGAKIKLAYQEVSKVLSTYTRTLVAQADHYLDGRLHPNFQHTGTRTGRLSCSSPNLQNISVRGEMGTKVRGCFVPEEGKTYVSADYSQIELRVLAHFCGGKLAEAYREDKDIHQQTADFVGVDRRDAKTLIFAVVYGAGANRVASILGRNIKECRRIMSRFKKTYPEIQTIKNKMVASGRERGYVKTLSGRRRYLPELSSHEHRWKGERLAANTPIQGGAADIMKIAMLDWHRKFGSGAPMVCQVHDEILLEVDSNTAEDVGRELKKVMEQAYALRVPLVAEPVIGSDWSEAK